MKYTRKINTKSTHKLNTNAVSTPFAQNAAVCDKNFFGKNEIETIKENLEKMKNQYRIEYYLIMFLLETGCRISEALNIKSSQIDHLGRVRIKGLKSSKNRIVTAPTCTQFFIQCKKTNSDVFARFNRFHIYRVCKKFGIGGKFGNNKKQSITHYFRHINAMIAREVAENTNEISEILGHKSTKSTEYYLQEKV